MLVPTFQDHSIRNDLLHMVLRLREQEEDVDDPPFDLLLIVIFFVQNTVQNQRQGIQDRAP